MKANAYIAIPLFGQKDFAVRLDEWLKKRQLTQKQFAEQLGVNQSQISRMCGAKPKWPAAKLMRKVVIATGDDVTPYDWLFPDGRKSAKEKAA